MKDLIFIFRKDQLALERVRKEEADKLRKLRDEERKKE